MIEKEPQAQTWDTYGRRIRQVRRAFGIESRFMWHKIHRPARFWNWLIDADRTTVSGMAPIVWFVAGGSVALVIIFIMMVAVIL